MDKNEVAKFISCLSVLEEKTYQLSEDLSKKVEGQYVSAILLYIAYNSLKNATILKGVASGISKSEIKTKDYERALGDTWRITNSLSEELSKKVKLDYKEVGSSAESLLLVCSITSTQLKTLELMAGKISEMYGMRLQDLRDVFELLTGDDQTNLDLLTKVKQIAHAQVQNAENERQLREHPISDCKHYYGFIAEQGCGVEIPHECLDCSKVLDCMSS
jgi:hypothetical protein